MSIVLKSQSNHTHPITKKFTVIAKPKKAVKARNEKKVTTPKEEAEELRKLKIAAKVFNVLSRKFPNAFSATPKPLAIGIKEDILASTEELGLSKTSIRIFLNIYVRSTNYRAVRIVNAERINLHGEVTGLVTYHEANYYKEKRSK